MMHILVISITISANVKAFVFVAEFEILQPCTNAHVACCLMSY